MKSTQSVTAITTLVLAMLIHPETQRSAQEELDRVVGRDRLPGFEDRESLPYISALVKEVIRCGPNVLSVVEALRRTTQVATNPAPGFVSICDLHASTDQASGVAHKSVADDEYNGYHIPRGSLVIGNSWYAVHASCFHVP